jgi:hypothetical protein
VQRFLVYAAACCSAIVFTAGPPKAQKREITGRVSVGNLRGPPRRCVGRRLRVKPLKCARTSKVSTGSPFPSGDVPFSLARSAISAQPNKSHRPSRSANFALERTFSSWRAWSLRARRPLLTGGNSATKRWLL